MLVSIGGNSNIFFAYSVALTYIDAPLVFYINKKRKLNKQERGIQWKLTNLKPK